MKHFEARHLPTGRGRGPSAVLAGGALVIAGIMALGRTSDAAQDDPIDTTRATIEQWVEARRLISEEKRDWAVDRELLGDRIALVEREIEGFRARVKASEANITETDRQRSDLEAESAELDQATQGLTELISGFEQRLRGLLPRLPLPLRERVKIFGARLPVEGAEVKASLAERYQNVVVLLNEIDKFNREITLSIEVRDLPDGTSVEVSTMYVGIGQAYYASASGTVAGIGSANATEWTWTPANEHATAILSAIAVQRNEQPAAFIQLPLRVE